jgi:L-asparaginase
MSRCAIVTTGGTIVSRIDERTGLATPVLSGDELVETLQGVTDPADLEVIDYIRVASPQITPRHWVGMHAKIQALVERDDIGGVVVTHGTSTLEETAWFLDLTLSTDKPVVVTGAQRNVSEVGFDGPRNLLAALRVCRCDEARGLGVLVVLNDHVNAAREVTKTHTIDVETFQSGEWGYLGSLVKDRVVFHRRPSRHLHLPLELTRQSSLQSPLQSRLQSPLPAPELPPVEIVSMYAGASGAMVRAAADSGARGVVVQAVASGHVNAAMQEAIVDVLGRGIPVVVSTRIPKGGTRLGYGFAGSSQQLVQAGAVLSGDLSPWKARIVLMLAIQAGRGSPAELRQLFDA